MKTLEREEINDCVACVGVIAFSVSFFLIWLFNIGETWTVSDDIQVPKEVLLFFAGVCTIILSLLSASAAVAATILGLYGIKFANLNKTQHNESNTIPIKKAS